MPWDTTYCYLVVLTRTIRTPSPCSKEPSCHCMRFNIGHLACSRCVGSSEQYQRAADTTQSRESKFRHKIPTVVRLFHSFTTVTGPTACRNMKRICCGHQRVIPSTCHRGGVSDIGLHYQKDLAIPSLYLSEKVTVLICSNPTGVTRALSRLDYED